MCLAASLFLSPFIFRFTFFSCRVKVSFGHIPLNNRSTLHSTRSIYVHTTHRSPATRPQGSSTFTIRCLWTQLLFITIRNLSLSDKPQHTHTDTIPFQQQRQLSMPLLKKKPFPLLSPPECDLERKESRDRQVWVSSITGEIFTMYP